MTTAFFALLAARFGALEGELNQLDAAIGDGDHGTTMLRGLTAAAAAGEGTAAKAFRGASGGASGSLFGVVLAGLETSLTEPANLAATLADAAEKVTRLGQAKAGDKTMLDALIPAAAAATPAATLAAAARLAATQAAAGAQATTGMQAKRGRARYVEAGGRGHPDPGARSVAEILAVLAEFVEKDQ